MTDNQRLLADYVQNGSDAAFRDLVTRYLDLVYSAAVRLVGDDRHLAEDVVQIVFVDLARLAGTFSSEVRLGGWLHRHTCFVAAKTLRGERRRQSRERQAIEMNALQDLPEAGLAQVAPVLDEAINQLGATDRAAILLRFFERLDFRSVGEALGSNEAAAQKRVARALEKLHTLLKRRGIAFSAAALGTALAGQAVTAAPAGLAVSISGTALAAAAAAGAGTTLILLKFMTLTKLQLGIISAIVIAGVATTMVIQQQTKLRGANASLRQQVDELDRLKAENERLSNQLAQARTSKPMNDEQLSELLKLRGQVAALQNQKPVPTGSPTNAQPAKSRDGLARQLPAPTVPLLPAASWTNVGVATPEASFQTFSWAVAKKDLPAFTQAVAWDDDAKKQAEAMFAAAPESVRQKFGSIDGVLCAFVNRFSPESPVAGFGVVSTDIQGDEVTLIEQHQYEDGTVRQNPITMHHFDDGWRVVLGDARILRGFEQTLNTPASTTPLGRDD
jgi:RNA polymerase sigma factor (sigma-70 family)